MSGAWPYDDEVRAELAARLFALLPAMYRVGDFPPDGADDLRRFLEVVGAPLAAVRQNLHELHADLFVDTAGEAALPLLANLVGTSLVFRDADRNRLDVRGTVGWRRRKGTPAMLEELATELLGRQAPLVEGWKLLQVDQDLDLQRLERVLPAVRSPRVAESVDGPWDGPHHLVDVRAPTRRTGRYHPRHLTWYLHPTRLVPLSEGTAAFVGTGDPPLVHPPPALPDDTDWRYAFHPLGADWPLRVRSTGQADPVRTDRVGAARFAAAAGTSGDDRGGPGAYFGVPGRFTVRELGLHAAVAEPVPYGREPSATPASPAVARAPTELSVLAFTAERLTHPVRIELHAAPLVGLAPNLGAAVLCAELTLSAAGPGPLSAPAHAVPAGAVVLVRVRAEGGGRVFFPGATVRATGGGVDAAFASADGALAAEGMLLGAVVAELPAGWVDDDAWSYLAADGSLVRAHDGAVVPLVAPGVLDLAELTAVGPGAAWPVLPPTADEEGPDGLPGSVGRGPVVAHGGRVVRPGFVPAGGAVTSAVVFALRVASGGVTTVRPTVRVQWTGDDPAGGVWTALTDAGTPTQAGPRMAALAAWLGAGGIGAELVVRFESSATDATLAPAEVVWTGAVGGVVLVHLPQLAVSPVGGADPWATPLAGASSPVRVAADGSTWALGAGFARLSHGAVAPLRGSRFLVRRRVRGRSLCPWRNETALDKLAGTPPGELDVDVTHGLFAFAAPEPPAAWPLRLGEPVPPTIPPNVTVDYEDGRTDHVGAMPAAREPELDLRQPAPTRIVSRSGALPEGAEPATFGLPVHRTLGEALAAATGDVEVVMLADSATFEPETLVFPAAGRVLVIQAAERRRPVVRLVAPSVPGANAWESITVRGVAFAGQALVLPAAARVDVQFCTFAEPTTALQIDLSTGGEATVVRSLTARIAVDGRAALHVFGSVLDGGPGAVALDAEDAEVTLDRVTVLGGTRVRTIEASECVFDGTFEVADRLRGCVRFSRVPQDALLPRNYRCERGAAVRLVSRNPHDAAYARLDAACPPAITSGAADGGEMGAFHDADWGPLLEAVRRRLTESTPAGQRAGFVRLD